MDKKFFLVLVVMEFNDCVTTAHALYSEIESAETRLQKEKAECLENFPSGDVLIDLPDSFEFRSEDGQGFVITVDEVFLES